MKKIITILCGMIIFGSALADSITSCPRHRLTLHCCKVAGTKAAFWVPLTGAAADCKGISSDQKLVPSSTCTHQTRMYLSEKPEHYEESCGLTVPSEAAKTE